MMQARLSRPPHVPSGMCLLLGLSLLLGTAAAPARGQFTLSSQPSLADRDRLYEQLAVEVEALERLQGVVKRVITLVQPVVVHIEAKRSLDRPSNREVEEAGSGVIIGHLGQFYVLTNRHVIKHSTPANIDIRLADGRMLQPTRVWADRQTDVAVMQIEAANLISARLGDSGKVEIGDGVLVIGSPFGLSHSVTHGIISAKGRRDLKLGDNEVVYQDFFQTDAAINPGNSGGPLLNLRGEVVGINTAIASSSGGNEGIGFSIPINAVMSVANQLVEHGRVERAFLGVTLDSDYDAATAVQLGLSRPVGALVKVVTPGSAAARAQVRAGDVILQFNGVTIEDDNHLVNQVKLTPLEQEVPLVLLRDGKTLRMQVKLGAEGPNE